jgi:DNA-directed RNA polymerase subunit RPC12/RpoP
MTDSLSPPDPDDLLRKVWYCANCGKESGETKIPRVDYKPEEMPLSDRPADACPTCGRQRILVEIDKPPPTNG